MGGPGSGTWLRWNKRPTLEDTLAVDVRDWGRRGLLVPGTWFSWQWSRGGQAAGAIQVQARAGRVVLHYRTRSRGDQNWRSAEQPVELTFTACYLGGRRPWFLCPRCARRVAKLFLAGTFTCRRCVGLPYASQGETVYDRAARRADKVRRRLGGRPGGEEPFPPRPRWMRHRTYERLRDAEAQFRDLADEGSLVAMQGLMARPSGQRRSRASNGGFWDA